MSSAMAILRPRRCSTVRNRAASAPLLITAGRVPMPKAIISEALRNASPPLEAHARVL
jgi:hypothetical protein